MRGFWLRAGLATLVVGVRGGLAQEATKGEADAVVSKVASKATRGTLETATFGGGCFWSIEAVFEQVPGVKSVVSGFAGGQVAYPSYELVKTGTTGHAEVVRVEFDPEVVPYPTLLKVFWAAHDPTTVNRQGDDFGPQYRSAIFYESDSQKRDALTLYRALTARRSFRSPIVTELAPLAAFYPAEPYHQDYFRNHRDGEYTRLYILPKLRKMRHKWLTVLRPQPATTASAEGVVEEASMTTSEAGVAVAGSPPASKGTSRKSRRGRSAQLP